MKTLFIYLLISLSLITNASAGVEIGNTGMVDTQTISDAGLNETDQISNILKQDSLFWILASFFGFGLLLSLTPCVFPMIPILSGIIVGHKGKMTTNKALWMSIVFVLSMSVTYALAGMLAGYFGENLQVLFQTPWILVVFSLIFVALAFSMFGFYDIQLPQSVQGKIASISNKQESGHLIGVSIMGFLSALIVGPCVAPPLAGALIYIGQTGDAMLGGMALFVMSLGMGVPLVAIGAGVSKLPKAGGWMDNVKYVFGILMLAVAIWLLERIVSEMVTLVLWAGLFTLSPIAIGVLHDFGKDGSGWKRLMRGIGLIVLGYGIMLWILVGKGGGDMLAPLKNEQPVQMMGSVEVQKAHVEFEPIKTSAELDIILEKSAKDNKIVMLDFYADWCVSCKALEKAVFSAPQVIREMVGVVVLKADVTANNLDDKELMKRFGVIGPPSILFFNNGIEKKNQRIIGEVDVEYFLERLKKSK